MAKKELDPVHPTRLGLALNYSVFQYETLNDISTAISLSREISDLAFNDIEKLDVIPLYKFRMKLINWLLIYYSK